MRNHGRSLGHRFVALFALATVAVPAVAVAQEAVRYRDEIFTDEEIASSTDIVYGHATNSQGEWQELLLDLHQPAVEAALIENDEADQVARRGAVVWVHGGFFRVGSKEGYRAEWSALARGGFVTASINYRLRPEMDSVDGMVMSLRVDEYVDATIDAQHDAQAAVRWLRANAGELRIDPERIAMAGHSAGAITAAMVAFNSDDVGTSGNPGYDSRIIAAVASAGGGIPERHLRIDSGEPPTLWIHALSDDVVPYPTAVVPCLLTIAHQNVCEQVLRVEGGHAPFGHAQTREFLHRWMYDRPGMKLPRVTFVDLE